MSIVHEACPSCAAPLDIPEGVSRIKCPYCTTSLAIKRHGNDVALALASSFVTTLEKSGTQTQDAIKEGSFVTQTELRRLQVAQDLSMAQMRLSNIHGEIRSIERLPATSITRKQLTELRANEIDLRRQIQSLDAILNPPNAAQAISAASKKKAESTTSRSKLPWLLFSTTGRASRRDYWLGIAITFVIFILIGATSTTGVDPTTGEPTSSLGFFATLLMLLFLWIGFAVSVKRYHDLGKPAWWMFIVLIPVIGIFWQVIELSFVDGNPGPNQYS